MLGRFVNRIKWSEDELRRKVRAVHGQDFQSNSSISLLKQHRAAHKDTYLSKLRIKVHPI